MPHQLRHAEREMCMELSHTRKTKLSDLDTYWI
jgi:hypothetical protein